MLYEELNDRLREECGVFGIYGQGIDLARLTYFGLFALQHRGQESAGMAVSDGKSISFYKGQGLVADVFTDQILQQLSRAQDKVAVGHVRYTTAGGGGVTNAQPLVARYMDGCMALVHNGNLVNANLLRREMEQRGYLFQTDSDSECILSLIAQYRRDGLELALRHVVQKVRGAYSLVMIYNGALVGLRDPLGIRPLCIGRKGSAYVLASESCALTVIGAQFVRDVRPGELVIIDDNGLQSIQICEHFRKGLCIFEYVYFARPDSTIEGRSVYLARTQMGRILAREHPVDADIVIAVPDSGRSAAVGYSQEAGIPFTEGLIKNRYVGRTFITPNQETRELKVRLKLTPIPEVFAGKRVVMVEDSIVRGTTIKPLIALVREAGATEVHVRVASPRYVSPCYYGIDTPSKEELIAARLDDGDICRAIGADSLGYLSLSGLLEAVQASEHDVCTACFTGNYIAGKVAHDETAPHV